jgi:CRISPR/Cas system-associated exonuclease Cas4 (RecB family)
MLWDYKTGVVPKKNEITHERGRFQLAGYLLAVQQGLTTVKYNPATRAGIICLKSSRDEHFQFQDYQLTASDWRQIIDFKLQEVAESGGRVGEGDYRPDPSQPPPARNNSCQYCPFGLLCGHCPETEGDLDE